MMLLQLTHSTDTVSQTSSLPAPSFPALRFHGAISRTQRIHHEQELANSVVLCEAI